VLDHALPAFVPIHDDGFPMQSGLVSCHSDL
jgi:hypothetical protein